MKTTMRISVDRTRCFAYGNCVMAAPEIFELGEDDPIVTVIASTDLEGRRSEIEAAIRSCPTRALRLEESA